MDANPYARILSVIRGEAGAQEGMAESREAGLGAAPCRMRLGIVTQRKPLEVTVAGIPQPAEALRINERLTDGAQWKMQLRSPDSDYRALSGSLSGPVSCPQGTVSHTVEAGRLHSTDTVIGKDSPAGMATAEQLELDLEEGDRVLLLTEDDQRFYLLMKVVDAV